MNTHVAPVLAAVAALGVVGGVAATQAFKPADSPQQPRVELVQPAAVTVTTPPASVTVTATPSPTTTTATVKVVKPKVESSSPKQTTQQRQAIVSEQPTEPQVDEPVAEPTQAVSNSGPPPRQGGAGGNYVCSPTGCVTQAP